jgi:hypothetical protein
LAPVNGSDSHLAACLLESSVRKRIWEGLQSGRDRESLVRMAAAATEPATPPAAEIPAGHHSSGRPGDVPTED